MSLVQKLKNWWEYGPDGPPPVIAEFDSAPQPKPPAPIKHGKVVRAGKHPEYSPLNYRHGGRVVKTMPRQLRRIKEAQERLSDD